MDSQSLQIAGFDNDTVLASLAACGADVAGTGLGMAAGASAAVGARVLMTALSHDLLLVSQKLELGGGQS
jgi:hypothetical protein